MHKAMSKHQGQLALWFILGSVLFSFHPASAARLLDVYIEQDGMLIVHSYYEDGGRADAATVWRYLADPPIMVDDDVAALDVEGEDPLNMKLTGDLEIRIQHGDGTIARTRLSSLMLRRESPQTQAWFLSESEVERTAFVAGLGSATTLPAGLLDGYLVTITAAVLILLACMLMTFFLLRGPKTRTA